MTPRHAQRKPGFLWQGLLILLPVAVLAAVGLVSLRNDRQLARQEAIQRAQTVADGLLDHLWSELLPLNPDATNASAFLTGPKGELIKPASLNGPPAPRNFDLSLLTPRQAELWRDAQSRTAAGANLTDQVQAWRALIDSGPPAPFAPVALYSSAVLAAEARDTNAALSRFREVIEKYPDACGESGLPLSPLSSMKLLELQSGPEDASAAQAEPLLENFCSNIVTRPLPITPLLLELAAQQAGDAARIADKWQRVWAQDQVARAVYDAAMPQMSAGMKFFWVSNSEPVSLQVSSPKVSITPLVMETTEWLVARGEPSGSNTWYSYHSEAQLGVVATRLAEETKVLPPYCAVQVLVAGRKVRVLAPDTRMWRETGYFGRRGGGVRKEVLEDQAREVLASADKGGPAGDGIRVNVLLTSPTALYKAQRTRTIWFAALITVSAAAAFGGLLAAWRAFGRQRQLNELKSNFVSSVSHELRAPIASVRLMAESLERGKIAEEPRRQEYFRFISQECRRLSSLIENVLDFSRIDQGRKRYEFEPADLPALVRTTVQLMEPYAAEREITLRAEVGPNDECQACVDAKAIQQAVINLLDNAIKHSPRGETVKVGLDKLPPNGDPADSASAPAGVPRIGLWVEDNGEGIPAEEHERIFERFYRLGSELRRETTGVGIGLSIVKHIVEGHAGRVIVRSAPGQGSRFTIEIPAGVSVAPSREDEA